MEAADAGGQGENILRREPWVEAKNMLKRAEDFFRTNETYLAAETRGLAEESILPATAGAGSHTRRLQHDEWGEEYGLSERW